MVLVPVWVTDVMDRPVMDLQKDDFALFQDDEQQKLEYFSTEDAPVSAGMILDLSKSMSNKFDMERQAVSEFFKAANEQDDYLVITFSDHPRRLPARRSPSTPLNRTWRCRRPMGTRRFSTRLPTARTGCATRNTGAKRC